ncbi:MAG: DUF4838 domain-containing protein [Kiritimatiellae bacterium]|nr:DUF4838 domain-containing protein [Kiritimatiellia bacterium]
MKRGLAVLLCALTAALSRADLVWVDGGVCRAPIVLARDAPAATAQAATDLARYVEKISGVKPPILAGAPEPLPATAIWVGAQPALARLFPGLPPAFEKPEEVLIACNGRHALVAGRDRLLGGRQVEYGTANAVYTFLQMYLDVRWLWPGPLGEDVVRRATLALPAFTYRFQPPFRQRGDVFRLSRPGARGGRAQDWLRLQRLALDTVQAGGGHPFADWWNKYHETHPDYFALQPDGTRRAYPEPKTAKLCQANPAVWAQWLANVEATLKQDPTQTLFGGGANDSYSSGICVCEKCRAWDAPEAIPWRYNWKGLSAEGVAMTDRYATFWNMLADRLKARFPERDDLFVIGSAYGPSTPPPVKTELRDNILVSYVGHFPFCSEGSRAKQKAEWLAWAAKAPRLRYRPNYWYWAGGVWGLPEVAMTKTIEDFRFLAENRCTGLFVDTAWENWATQAPQYYLMAQLAWDPLQDGEAVLKDYYRRGFGPAAAPVEAYWRQLEAARDAVMATPNLGRGIRRITAFPTVYDAAFFARADAHLREAAARLAAGPDVYRQRLAFLRTGFEFTRLFFRLYETMAPVRASKGRDAAAVQQANAAWAAFTKLLETCDPLALAGSRIRGRLRKGYMGGLQEYLGPPGESPPKKK